MIMSEKQILEILNRMGDRVVQSFSRSTPGIRMNQQEWACLKRAIDNEVSVVTDALQHTWDMPRDDFAAAIAAAELAEEEFRRQLYASAESAKTVQ